MSTLTCTDSAAFCRFLREQGARRAQRLEELVRLHVWALLCPQKATNLLLDACTYCRCRSAPALGMELHKHGPCHAPGQLFAIDLPLSGQAPRNNVSLLERLIGRQDHPDACGVDDRQL